MIGARERGVLASKEVQFMKNTLVVVADLGCLKAYRLENNHLQRTPKLELVEHFENPQVHSHVVDQLSDQSGRFRPGGATGGAMSGWEPHNYHLEQRKRYVRDLAQRLNTVASAPDIERCFLAASKEIGNQLVEQLTPQVRAKIQKLVPADLTKVDRADLLGYF